jgi:hypothetical protein
LRLREGSVSDSPWLAREIRGSGDAVVATSALKAGLESHIARAGMKVIFRTDYPRDVTFAASLMQVEPRFLSRLRLGTGLSGLPVRYYRPFLLTFPEQSLKNTVVPDAVVRGRWLASPLGAIPPEPATPEAPVVVAEEEHALLCDVNDHPTSTVTRRYERLGWNPKTGNAVKDDVIRKGLAVFSPVTTPTGVAKDTWPHS